MRICILGAGISGLGAHYYLRSQNIHSVVFEKDSTFGGLCGNFELQGFRFDRFVHFSHTKDPYVQSLFSKSCESVVHPPLCSNYYRGYWLKHPAQNNLFPLSEFEKSQVLEGFGKRPTQFNDDEIKNYEEWLRIQYGDYFAENFPMAYTRKYWTKHARELETSWVGKRMYIPSLDEVRYGIDHDDSPNRYYAQEMRYPIRGGYKTYLKELTKDSNILYNKEVVRIDSTNKVLYFSDGSSEKYDILLSSIPLPEYRHLLTAIPEDVLSALDRLEWTKGYQVSLGFKRPDIPKHLWFYIYDEDVLAARVYSPSLKSPDNAPPGCSSLQAEIYLHSRTPNHPAPNSLLSSTIAKLRTICNFFDEDILVKDIRLDAYANVIYSHGIRNFRNTVHQFLSNMGIRPIGRFGEWAYLWSDQSLLSGYQGAKETAEILIRNQPPFKDPPR